MTTPRRTGARLYIDVYIWARHDINGGASLYIWARHDINAPKYIDVPRQNIDARAQIY